MIKHALLSIALLSVLGACSRQVEEPEAAPADAAAATSNAATTPGGEPEGAPEPPKVVATVNAQIRLSAEAEQAVSSQGDTVTVEAIYAGDPTPASQGQVNALGLIELGKASQQLKGSGSVGFDKSSIDDSRLGLIVGQPQVILNVHSAKRLITCPMYWESVKVASEKTVEISCALAGAGTQ